MDVIKLSRLPQAASGSPRAESDCSKLPQVWVDACCRSQLDPRDSRRKGILPIAHNILNHVTPPSPCPLKGQTVLQFSNPPILKALFGLGGIRVAQAIRPPIRRMSDGVLDLCLPGMILPNPSLSGVRVTRRGKRLLNVFVHDFCIYHFSLKMAFSGVRRGP